MTDEALRYETAPQRRRQILDTLHSHGFAAVIELAGQLGVSDMTVRRDLRRLAADGEVVVVRGGVHLPADDMRASGFAGRIQHNPAAKRSIAGAARDLVGSRDTIALDAGTTVCAMTEALPERFAGSVVTHSIPVIQQFLAQGGTHVVALGGDLYPVSEAFVGPMTVEAAERLRVRTFFLGAAALDHRGVYVDSDIERPTKLALMDIADQIVLLADATKFTSSAPVLLSPLDRLTAVVTDRRPPRQVADRLAATGCRLILGSPSRETPRNRE